MVRRLLPAALATAGAVLAGAGPAAAVPTSVSCSSQQLTVTPLQSGVFYIDADQNYLGSYVGYRVANAGASTRAGLWMQLESFSGTVVRPASGAATTAPLPLDAVAAGSSTPAYAYLKATGATAAASTHQLVLYSGRPGSGGVEVCRDTQTISAVADVIKAAANKVSGATRSGSPSLGGTFTLTVTGETGTVGSGPANDPGVVRFSPAVAATWPSSAFRLVGVSHKLPASGGAFADVLWRGSLALGNTPYAVTYTFRVVGPTSTPTPLVPVQNIASGTQVKHTDPGTLTSLEAIPVVTSQSSMAVAAPTAGPYTAGQTVPFTATVTNAGSGAVALDEITATLPSGWTYKAGTATVDGGAVADPFVSGGTGLRFVGPYTVTAGGTRVVRLEAVAGAAGTSGTFSAAGTLAGGRVDGTTAVDDDTPATVTVNVLGAPTAGDDAVGAASGGVSTWDVLANDQTAGGTPVLTISADPAHGTASVVDGRIEYEAEAGYSGGDTLEYTLTTAGGSDTATVTITVATPPAPPTPDAETSAGTGTDAQSATVDVPAGGSARLVTTGGDRVLTWTREGIGVYTIDGATGVIGFVPVLGYSGSPAVTFEVTDSFGQAATALYTATVAKPAPPAPAALTSTGVGGALHSRTLAVPTGGTVRLLDGGAPVTTLTVAGEGRYDLDPATGEVTFAPALGFHGAATGVPYRATDAYAQSAASTYTPTVTLPAGPAAAALTSTGVGTAPQSRAVTVPVDGAATLLTAGGSAAASVTVAGQGTYAYDAGAAAVTFTPVLGFAGPATPVTYRVADVFGQTATATYTPTVTAPAAASAPALTSTGVGRDSQARTLAVPAGGRVRLLEGGTPATTLAVAGEGEYTLVPATGVVTFVPARGFHGPAATVAYRATDAYGQTADGTYRPTVTLPVPPATAPRTSTGVGTAAQSVTVTVPDAAALTPAGDLTVPEGTYVLDAADARITFTPRAGALGAATPLAFRVTDEYGQHDEATYTPTVTAPDGPAAPARTSTGTGTEVQKAGLEVPAGGRVRLLDAAGHEALSVTTDAGIYTLDAESGAVSFAPRHGFAGAPPAVRYVVADVWGQTAEGTYTPAVLAPAGPAAAPQASVGKPAEPQARIVTVPAGGHAELLDEGGRAVSVVVVPGQGEYRVEPGTGVITFLPAAGFTGTPRAVRYRVVDAYGQAVESSYQPDVERAPVRACVSRRTVEIHWWVPATVKLRRITVTVGGRRVAVLDGRVRRVTADLRGRPKGVVQVAILGRDARGRAHRTTRTYRLCSPLTPHAPLKTLKLWPSRS